MTNLTINPAAADLAAFLEAQELPPSPLPLEITRAMRAHGAGCYASGEVRGDWRPGTPLRETASRWLDKGADKRGARCEFIERGFHSNSIQIVFESPRCGVFLSKLVSEAFDDAAIRRGRIEGSFGLMRALLEATDRASAWPAGKRLVIVDNDNDGLLYWAWVAEKGARWGDLAPDAAAWISALLSVEALGLAS